MYVKNLSVFNFRNLAPQKVELGNGVNIFIGDNGQGKTNLVEAISLLSIGRSFRSSEPRDLILLGETSASVFAEIDFGEGAHAELGFIIKNGEKKALINKQELPGIAALFGRLITMLFAPQEIVIVKGPPQFRRNFLDRHVAEANPKLFANFVALKKALKHKRALLKSAFKDPAQLDSWDEIIAHNSMEIEKARLEFLPRLERCSKELMAQLAAQDAELSLSLDSALVRKSAGESKQTPVELDYIREVLSKARSREVELKSCLVGPQRDDIEIKIAGKDARSFASQGQARSVVLALKMGVIEMLEREQNIRPVILLDDLDSELDPQRKAAVYELLFNKPRQVIITGTEDTLASNNNKLEVKKMRVQNGIVSEY